MLSVEVSMKAKIMKSYQLNTKSFQQKLPSFPAPRPPGPQATLHPIPAAQDYTACSALFLLVTYFLVSPTFPPILVFFIMKQYSLVLMRCRYFQCVVLIILQKLQALLISKRYRYNIYLFSYKHSKIEECITHVNLLSLVEIQLKSLS